MKKDGKYRFSLQFPDNTEENRMAGELLERLGNRKSAVIVAALNEYQEGHPELKEGGCRIEISMTSSISKEELEQMVRKAVEERLCPADPLKYRSSGPVTGKDRMQTSSEPEGKGGERKGEAVQDMAGPEEQLEEHPMGAQAPEGLEKDISMMLDNLDFFA